MGLCQTVQSQTSIERKPQMTLLQKYVEIVSLRKDSIRYINGGGNVFVFCFWELKFWQVMCCCSFLWGHKRNILEQEGRDPSPGKMVVILHELQPCIYPNFKQAFLFKVLCKRSQRGYRFFFFSSFFHSLKGRENQQNPAILPSGSWDFCFNKLLPPCFPSASLACSLLPSTCTSLASRASCTSGFSKLLHFWFFSIWVKKKNRLSFQKMSQFWV